MPCLDRARTLGSERLSFKPRQYILSRWNRLVEASWWWQELGFEQKQNVKCWEEKGGCFCQGKAATDPSCESTADAGSVRRWPQDAGFLQRGSQEWRPAGQGRSWTWAVNALRSRDGRQHTFCVMDRDSCSTFLFAGPLSFQNYLSSYISSSSFVKQKYYLI